jgi:hypothetical protein
VPGAVPRDEHGVPREERDQAPPVRNRGAKGKKNLVSTKSSAASWLVSDSSWRRRITFGGIKIWFAFGNFHDVRLVCPEPTLLIICRLVYPNLISI